MKRAQLKYGIISSLALLSFGFLPLAHAQENYPNRVVRIIVPFPPGSILDGLTRIVSEGLSKKWSQSVIVENVSGAGGNIGTYKFAQSPPDGYTLIAAPPGPFTINRLLFDKLNYDASTFKPITIMGTVPAALVVRKDFPAKDLEGFISYARANPGRISYGSQGIGTSSFLTAKLLESRANVEMLHVPYRGSSSALSDIISGDVDCIFDALSNAVSMERQGNIRILAITDLNRSEALPTAPTVMETLPGFLAVSWFALAAPAGTPNVLLSRISSDVQEIINTPEINRRLRDIGLTPGKGTPEIAAKFIADEDAIWSTLIREIGLKPQ